MKEQKFYIPALVFGALGAVLGFLMLSAEAVVSGCIGLALSVMKRTTHRVKLSIVLSVIAILSGAGTLLWMFYAGSRGIAGFEYWFFRLFY